MTVRLGTKVDDESWERIAAAMRDGETQSQYVRKALETLNHKRGVKGPVEAAPRGRPAHES